MGVMLLKDCVIQLQHFHSSYTETFLLKTIDNFANQRSLYCTWFK